jgi:DNA invertase Pin-like site-specific DNA recombinase
MPAVAYLRRSRVDTSRPGSISHEQQLAGVRDLAQRNGDDPDRLMILEDWGRSGRISKQGKRDDFAKLLELVASEDASAVYAYSLSRLGRSIETLAILIERCSDRKIPIRCVDGFSPDTSSPTGALVATIIGSVHRWQAEWTRERAAEGAAIRRTRGDHIGPAPYGFRVVDGKLHDRPGEDLELVIAAFRAEQSFQGAARRLTLDGVPTRKGGIWQASTVHDMLADRAPDILPPSISRARVTSSFRLSGLLRCPHDGGLLTGRHFRGSQSWPSYHCRRAGTDPTHPYPRSIAENRILPWIVAEIEHLEVPIDQTIADVEAEARRPALEARRERVTEAFLDGTIDKLRRDAELLAIADELEGLSDRSVVIDVPSIDWTWAPNELNTVLRAVLRCVELGPDLKPLWAEWMVPEWRAA